MYSPEICAIALFSMIVLRNPLSSCHMCLIGMEVSFLNRSMRSVVSCEEPSSAITISSGKMVCVNILLMESSNASGQLYVDTRILTFIF